MLSDHARGLLSAVSTHLRMAAECVSAVAEGRPVTVDPSVLAPIEEGEHEAPTDAPAGVVEAAPPGLREATARLLAEISWHGDYRTNDDHRVLRDLRVGTLREVAAAMNGEADGGEERPSTRSLFAGEQPFRVVLGEQNLMIQAWTRELLRGLHLSNPTAGNVVGQLNRLFALAGPLPASAAPPGDERLREAAESTACLLDDAIEVGALRGSWRAGDPATIARRLRAALDAAPAVAPCGIPWGIHQPGGCEVAAPPVETVGADDDRPRPTPPYFWIHEEAGTHGVLAWTGKQVMDFACVDAARRLARDLNVLFNQGLGGDDLFQNFWGVVNTPLGMFGIRGDLPEAGEQLIQLVGDLIENPSPAAVPAPPASEEVREVVERLRDLIASGETDCPSSDLSAGGCVTTFVGRDGKRWHIWSRKLSTGWHYELGENRPLALEHPWSHEPLFQSLAADVHRLGLWVGSLRKREIDLLRACRPLIAALDRTGGEATP